MITFRESLQIDSPPARVFGFISDLGNIPKWQSEVVNSTVVTPGPVRVGTRFDEVVKIGPWRVNAQCAVTEFEPARKMGFEARSAPVRYGGVFLIEAAGNGSSRVTVQGTARLHGAWKLMQPLLAGDIRKGIRQELAAIKRSCEG